MRYGVAVPVSRMSLTAPRVLGIGGSVRPGSASELALRVAAAGAAQCGAEVRLITGSALDLPTYGSLAAASDPNAADLLQALRAADGLLLATPAYHGSLSGMLKNALDYVEELRNDQRVYLDGVAVGCIAVAAGGQAAVTTLQTMRTIVHSLRGWPTPLGAALTTSPPGSWPPDGPGAEQLALVGQQVATFGGRAERRALQPVHSS